MSAYAHQMEREYSAQSLSSRGSGTENGSRYVVEPGFYISSFAGIVFIASLVIVGLLLFTLLITLIVMLQSCQNQNAGVVEVQKLNDDYNYCKIFTLHAEFNGWKADDFPSVCRSRTVQYIKDGRYAKDLKDAVLVAESYFKNLKPLDGGLDVVLLDIDDLLPSGFRYAYSSAQSSLQEARDLKKIMLLKLFMQLLASRWPVILLSRKSYRELNATTYHLNSAGFRGWSSLIMRMDDEIHLDSGGYLSKRRMALQNEGFHISAIISSQMDALTGPSLGNCVFKLPNMMYYDFGSQSSGAYMAE